jgi:hypothetical protein
MSRWLECLERVVRIVHSGRHTFVEPWYTTWHWKSSGACDDGTHTADWPSQATGAAIKVDLSLSTST